MKRTELIRKITSNGAIFVRHGSNHDIYVQPKNGNTEPVPRHNEIKEFIARKIIKNLS
ncbi:MAG: type II toxin-antitoxin system HicA family toxin [Spirochaetaceae bacterium]|nr:type II toxin-antitoxin system HicA family toxin [Spirochaetaceae bacterium]